MYRGVYERWVWHRNVRIAKKNIDGDLIFKGVMKGEKNRLATVATLVPYIMFSSQVLHYEELSWKGKIHSILLWW